MTETTFETKCSILADVWTYYRNDEEFADFIEYNDLGLPLAYCIANEIIVPTAKSKEFVSEAFDLLLAGLEIKDTGFESLNHLLALPEDE